MSYMKDAYADICELYSKGFKAITIAAMTNLPLDLVESSIVMYNEEYDLAFYADQVAQSQV